MEKISFKSLTERAKDENTYKRKIDLHPQVHAKRVDKLFGFRIPKIEVKLLQKYRAYYKSNDDSNKKQHYEGTQTWIGLHPQALQTPYNDIYEALLYLKQFNIKEIIDIGAGYGRVGLVMNSIFPKASFLGYEILKQREREANRVFASLEMNNCEIKLKNVLDDDFKLPMAQIYFIYDFSELDDLCTILDVLSKRLSDHQFFLITRGDRIDYLLQKKYKEFWLANNFIRSGELKIYSSYVDLAQIESN